MKKGLIIKEKLIKNHLGIATPDWIVQNCIKMLNEFEYVVLTIPDVVGQSEQLCKHDWLVQVKDGGLESKCVKCGEKH